MGELRVAAYCRVSTDKTDQRNSLRAQREYFESFIMQKDGWRLVEIFADEGVTGTSTARRTRFNEMVSLAFAGGIDLIVTKDVSRFARNTLDTLHYTRLLKDSGVGVVFINDNINTLDGEGEFRLAIMASVAQEESRKTSERVRWGQRRVMQSGKVFGNNSIMGYDITDGELVINEAEAAVVRLIFKKYAEQGKGCRVIARELNEGGIVPRRAEQWSQQSVLKIIKNEKYAGDLIQQKYITPDHLSHKKIENRDETSYIVIKNHHEPIVSRRQWNKAQKLLDQRRQKSKAAVKAV